MHAVLSSPGGRDDVWLEGVFSARERAQAFIDAHGELAPCFWIEEHAVDTAQPVPHPEWPENAADDREIGRLVDDLADELRVELESTMTHEQLIRQRLASAGSSRVHLYPADRLRQLLDDARELLLLLDAQRAVVDESRTAFTDEVSGLIVRASNFLQGRPRLEHPRGRWFGYVLTLRIGKRIYSFTR